MLCEILLNLEVTLFLKSRPRPDNVRQEIIIPDLIPVLAQELGDRGQVSALPVLPFPSSVKGTQAVPYEQQLPTRLHPTKMSTFVHPDTHSRKFTAPLLTVKS